MLECYILTFTWRKGVLLTNSDQIRKTVIFRIIRGDLDYYLLRFRVENGNDTFVVKQIR